MTTIVVKGGVMASDGLATGGYSGIQNDIIKIHRIGDSIFGFAGIYRPIEKWEEWARNGCMIPELPKESIVVRLSPGDKITVFEYDNDYVEQVYSGVCAIGSGHEYAQGALEAGATARESVKIASKYDKHTNSNIRTLELKNKIIKEEEAPQMDSVLYNTKDFKHPNNFESIKNPAIIGHSVNT